MRGTSEIQRQDSAWQYPVAVRSIFLLVVWGGMLVTVPACHRPTPPAPVEETPRAEDTPPLPEVTAPVDAVPQRITIDVAVDDPDRWLFVEKVRRGAPGAWATGSFNPERNKLTIRTRDVQQFAIDTDRIPIDWERLVILGIDGHNSELRKRDYFFLHFARDRHGRWIVQDP